MRNEDNRMSVNHLRGRMYLDIYLSQANEHDLGGGNKQFRKHDGNSKHANQLASRGAIASGNSVFWLNARFPPSST